MADILNGADPTDIALVGAAPLVRKLVQAIVEKWPSLYPWATPLSVVIGTAVVALSQSLPLLFAKFGVSPVMVDGWIKGGLALAGLTSVYSDWRDTKKTEAIKNKALAVEAAPEVVAAAEAKDKGAPADVVSGV